MSHKILMVEDDPSIAHTLSAALKLSGYQVTVSSSVKEATKMLEDSQWDLLLLDLNLPDGSGYTVCKYARELYVQLPILILSAKTDEESVLRGLSGGAVDYMRKPTGPREIVLRIKKALGDEERVVLGSLQINCRERTAQVQGKVIELRRREYDILHTLAKLPDRVIKREELLERIKADEDISDRAIDCYLSRIRKKLREAGAKDLEISNVYGVGYCFKQVGKPVGNKRVA